MVPGPLSNNIFEAPTCIRTEHELRVSDGTQVPEPKIVTFIPDWSDGIFNWTFLIFVLVNFKPQLFVIRYLLLGLSLCDSKLFK